MLEFADGLLIKRRIEGKPLTAARELQRPLAGK
jgi:hypothetical protein